MSFKDWLFSNREYNVEVNGQWGLKHILVLVLCIATIIALAIIFRRRSEKTRKIVITTLISLIFILEIARRIINLVKTTDYTLNGVLYDLLPRPWCAISCWIPNAILPQKTA